jgi:hypothetical protein
MGMKEIARAVKITLQDFHIIFPRGSLVLEMYTSEHYYQK